MLPLGLAFSLYCFGVVPTESETGASISSVTLAEKKRPDPAPQATILNTTQRPKDLHFWFSPGTSLVALDSLGMFGSYLSSATHNNAASIAQADRNLQTIGESPMWSNDCFLMVGHLSQPKKIFRFHLQINTRLESKYIESFQSGWNLKKIRHSLS